MRGGRCHDQCGARSGSPQLNFHCVYSVQKGASKVFLMRLSSRLWANCAPICLIKNTDTCIIKISCKIIIVTCHWVWRIVIFPLQSGHQWTFWHWDNQRIGQSFLWRSVFAVLHHCQDIPAHMPHSHSWPNNIIIIVIIKQSCIAVQCMPCNINQRRWQHSEVRGARTRKARWWNFAN